MYQKFKSLKPCNLIASYRIYFESCNCNDFVEKIFKNIAVIHYLKIKILE